MRTLAKKPDQRPQTAAELARELQAAVAEPSLVASSLSQPSMPAIAAGSGGLRAARPDEETAEHQLGGPATAPAASPPAATPAPDFGSTPAVAEAPKAITVAAQTSRAKSPVPLILGGLAAGVGVGALVWFLTRSEPPPSPATLEPARQSVVVGATPSGGGTALAPTPPTEAPATAPPSPWERAIEFGKAGRHPEAAAQFIYLLRSSQDPWGVVERAKNDIRLEGALALPQVQDAIGALPPKGTPSAAP
jgi:hypothetical protein